MMRSMFSGVSSLRVHQTRMDVIANNIANVNTIGFKAARTTFSDAFYQRIQGAAGPDPLTGRAGTNAQQVGLGLNLATIDNLMSQGATQRTDNALDVMIAGEGFFIVSDAGGNAFTRAGNIQMDFHRNLHINGMQLMGWSTRVNETTGQHVVDRSILQPLQLGGAKQNMPSEPTTLLNFTGNLNINQLDDNDQVVRTMTVFDSLGHRYTIDFTMTFLREESEAADGVHGYWRKDLPTAWFVRNTDGDWEEWTPPPGTAGTATPPDGARFGVKAFLEGDREGPPSVLGICLFGTAIGETGNATSTEFAMNMHTSALIAFDSSGQMVGMRPARVEGARPATLADPRAATNISFSPTLAGNPAPSAALGQPLNLAGDVIPGSFFNQILIKPIAGVAPAATLGNVGFNNESQFSPGPPPPGTPVQGTVMTSVGSLTINMSEMFQRGGENTNLRSLTQNGNGPGELRDITIGGDGTIIGRFSNGRTRVLGQIPLAQFTNPAGLERLGANLWAETANSGMFDGVGVIGQMQGGALEMSNVDLAGEFTDMITTQRGFQAASRTITVSDEMLQELVNLRR